MIGSFQILRKLGIGGYGIVYLAEDSVLRRQVAIKVPHASMLVLQDDQDRFVQEAKIVATLQHSNIVEIFQVGSDADCRYIVFEYCAGGSLAEWLTRHPTSLSPQQCAEIILSLARAVDYAHQQGVAHRDLNPRNILLVPLAPGANLVANEAFPFIPKLSDFGLGTWLDERRTAVQTQTGAILGTLPYMAPEQTFADPETLSTAVDVYALGVILFEMLAGVRPFAGSTPVDTLRMIRETDPVSLRQHDPSIPRDLETICLKCLEKSPCCRYGSAGLLADDLELFLAGDPIRTRPISVRGKAARWIGRRRLSVAVASLALACLCVLLLGGAWLAWELNDARVRGQRLQEVSDARATRLKQTQAREQELQRSAKRQAELVRHLNYIDHIQLISGLIEKRPFDAVQMLREWIPNSQETDLRGFEWYYLMQACGGDIVSISAPTEVEDNFEGMRITDDGRQLYVANNRHARQRIVGWDLATGDPLATQFEFEFRSARDFVFNRKRNLLLVALGGSSLIDVQQLLPNAARRQFSVTPGMEWHCYRVLCSSDGRELVSICSIPSEFRLPAMVSWHDIDSGRAIDTVSWPTQRVFDAAIHPIDRSTIIAVEDSIEVYNSKREKIQDLKLTDRGPLRSMTLSADGTQLAVSTDQEQILLCRQDASGAWRLISETPPDGALRLPPDNRPCIPWNSVQFDATGRKIYFTHRTTMVVGEISSTGQLHEATRFSDLTIRLVAPLPDGSTAAWMTDRACGLWQPTFKIAPVAGHDKEAWSVAYTRGGTLLASGSDDHTVRLWNPHTGEMIGELTGHVATITKVDFSPNDALLATASLDGTVKIWDIPSRRLVKTLEGAPTQVRALTWLANGRQLVTGDCPEKGQPRRILVWDVDSGSVARSFTGFTDRIQAVVATSDQKLVIGASDDMSIRLFRLDTDRSVDTAWRLWTNDSAIRCAALLDQERKLATGDNNGVVRVWDVATGTEVFHMNGHTDSVLCLRLSPDGRVLASGGEDKSIYVWDVETGRRLLALKDLPTQVNGLAFSPAGDVLTAALHDGSVRHFYAPRIKPIRLRGR